MMSFASLYEKVRQDIAKYGWSSVGVFPDPDEVSPSPPFTYSVGFRGHDKHPEVIVIGLQAEVAHAIIGALYERVAAGEKFEVGDRVSELIQGYEMECREVPPDGAPLNVARRYYGLDNLPALQLVWPDKEGCFPGEDGFDPEFERLQDIALARL